MTELNPTSAAGTAPVASSRAGAPAALLASNLVKFYDDGANRIDVLRQQNLYKDMIDEKIIHQKNVVSKAEKEVEVARIELMEAHKDRKVMEKLKEKEYTFTMDQEKQEEQKQLDEMATLSFGKSFY